MTIINVVAGRYVGQRDFMHLRRPTRSAALCPARAGVLRVTVDAAVPLRALSNLDHLYAHTPPASHPEAWHLWADHARVVGNLAAEFGSSFQAGDFCRLLGLTHDAGKLTAQVQEALRRRAVDGAGALGCPHKVEGAAFAALLLESGNPVAAKVMALANYGHHHGIPDLADPERVDAILRFMNKNRRHLDDLVAMASDQSGVDLRELADRVRLPGWVTGARQAELFTRMCHSTLVDADFLDTASHFDASGVPWRGAVRGMDVLKEAFDAHYQRQYGGASGELAEVRWKYFEASRESAESERVAPGGIYRLPAPTGCGKTMSAAEFALTHAAKFGKRRVTVAVPYTSITTQNADVYRSAFADLGADVVLEHHSNILDGDIADDPWRRLAAANWDAEFIVTTTVQLLESLFSNRPSATRKLHRIVNSVVVVDEVQSFPLALLPSILRMMRELSENYGVTFLLASATQPAFWSLREWRNVPVIDVMPVDYVPAVSQRVTYEVRTEEQSWDEIASDVAQHDRALAIVNTTADAQLLHGLLAAQVAAEVPVLHLSTRMYASHRASVLAKAQRLLSEKRPVLLVSTQMIEAGVDIDFPAVFRAFAPADSIVQSAGRCNREGRLGAGAGRVVVFQPENPRLPKGEYALATSATRSLFIEQASRRVEGDPMRPIFGDARSMETYYQRLYTLAHDPMLATAAASLNSSRDKLAFQEVANGFKLIDGAGLTVVVNAAAEGSAGGLELLERLRLPGQFMSRSDRRFLASISATAPRWWRNAQEQLFETVGNGPRGGGPILWNGEYDPSCGMGLDVAGEATIW